MFVHIYVHICMYIIYMYIFICIYTYTCIYTYMNIHLYVECAYTFFCVCIQTHLLVCVYRHTCWTAFSFLHRELSVCVICESLSLSLFFSPSHTYTTQTYKQHLTSVPLPTLLNRCCSQDTYAHSHTDTQTHRHMHSHATPATSPPLLCSATHTHEHIQFSCVNQHTKTYMGWLRLVGSLKL